MSDILDQKWSKTKQQSIDIYNSPTKSHSSASDEDEFIDKNQISQFDNFCSNVIPQINLTQIGQNKDMTEKEPKINLYERLSSICLCSEIIDLSSLDSEYRMGDLTGLLIQLEVLAKQWNIIKEDKYSYRPTQIVTCLDIGTLVLAFKRVQIGGAQNSSNILIDKEYALTAAKLIQQFQILLDFIKNHLSQIVDESKSGGGMVQYLMEFIHDQLFCDKERLEDQLLQKHEVMLIQFRKELQHFERLFRVFEMTYIDLTQKMVETHQEQMLKSHDQTQVGYKQNQKGQVIISKGQMFDQNGQLIDKKSEIIVQHCLNEKVLISGEIDPKAKHASRPSSRLESATAVSNCTASMNSAAATSPQPKTFGQRVASTSNQPQAKWFSKDTRYKPRQYQSDVQHIKKVSNVSAFQSSNEVKYIEEASSNGSLNRRQSMANSKIFTFVE